MGSEQTARWYDRVYRRKAEYAKVPWECVYYPVWMRILGWVRPKERVADFGCGPGQFAWLALRSGVNYVLGVDFSKRAIRMARNLNPQHRHLFVAANLYDRRVYGLAEYTLAVFCEVLEHLEDDLAVLSNIRPGTRVVGTVPQFDSAGHVRFFKSAEEVSLRYRGAVDMSEIEVLETSNKAFIIAFRGVKR